MSKALKYIQNKDVAWREVDGKAVLVNPTTAETKVLNAVGTLTWKLLEEPRTLDELAAAIEKGFQVSRRKAHLDADEFLQLLLSKSLAKPHTPA